MDQPRCPAVEAEHGWRCQQTPGHDNPHAVVWARSRDAVRLRRWRDAEPAVDTGRDEFGDLVAAGEVSWALGCPVHEVVHG